MTSLISAVPEEESAADAVGDRPTSPRRTRADRVTSVPRARRRGVVFTFASLYNEPTQWARSLRGGLRHAPEGGGAPLRQARAPVVMRREGGAVFPLAASGGRPRHRARLRPVRVGRRSHERAVASAWRLRPVRVGATGKCRIRPPGRPVARGGGAGADGTSIPLVSLSPGPAGLCAPPEPGPGTRGGPRDGRRKQGRCLRRRSGRGLGVVVSQRGRPGREPLLIANGPSGPFPSGSGVRGPGWVRWGRSSAGFGWGSGSWRGPGRRAAAGRVGFFPARAEVPRWRRGRLARACGLTGPVAGALLHLTGAGPPSRSSSRPVRWCCTSERVAPTGRLRVFRAVPGFFLECRCSADRLQCAERAPLNMGGSPRR